MEGFRNIGGGVEPPNPPSVRHRTQIMYFQVLQRSPPPHKCFHSECKQTYIRLCRLSVKVCTFFFRMMRLGCLWVHAICQTLQVTKSCRNTKKGGDVNESVKARFLHPLKSDFVLTFWRAATVTIVIIGASSFRRALRFPRISDHLGEQTTSPLSGGNKHHNTKRTES